MGEIQRWADAAMFRAEPMQTDNKPRVHLISMNPDPLGSIAAAAKMYKGEVVRDLSEVTDEERISFFEDGTKTVLGAPFETVQFHFLIDGVTRAFTHQLVRQRTATYFQESMRFAVIDESFSDRVGLPPSLDGTIPAEQHWVNCMKDGVDPDINASREQRWRNKWEHAVKTVESAYKALVADGMPAEDARGLLPTNILTRVHYRTNLRDLIAHSGMRLCTQAQFEWRYVFNEIIAAIKNAEVVTPGYRGNVYMRERLAELFKPVCYQNGECGFKASFDRACTIRERVDANAAIGRSSEKWHLPFQVKGSWQKPADSKVGRDQRDDEIRYIAAIHPAEWALDPSAARS